MTQSSRTLRCVWFIAAAALVLRPAAHAQFSPAGNLAPVGGDDAGVAVGDFNSDGLPDLVVVNVGSAPRGARVYRGAGNGTFSAAGPIAGSDFSTPPAVADFDGDGRLDIVTGSAILSRTVTVVRGDGAGGWLTGTTLNTLWAPQRVGVGDFNGDGRPDVVVLASGAVLGSGTGVRVIVLLNNGSGNFADPTGANMFAVPESAAGIATADFNRDGRLDVAVAYTSGSVGILLGNGAGALGGPANIAGTVANSADIVSGDFNLDGNADLAVLGSNRVSAFAGNGNGGFLPPTTAVIPGISLSSLVAADFNRDGDLDLIASGGAQAALLTGTGGISFSVAAGSPFAVVNTVAHAAAGDLNNDGRPDLMLAGSSGVNVLLAAALAVNPPVLNLYAAAGESAPPPVSAGVRATSGPALTFSAASNQPWLGVAPGVGTTPATSAVTAGTAGLVPGVYQGLVTYSAPASLGGRLPVTLHVASPAGTLTASAGSPIPVNSPVAIASGDLNADGRRDLVFADNGAAAVRVFLGNGGGGFTAVPAINVSGSPRGVAIADFTGDGRLDIAVASQLTQAVTVLLGNGAGGFTAVPQTASTGSIPISITAGDFNADGHADVAVTNWGSSSVSVLLGKGDGTFVAAPGSPVSTAPQPLAAVTSDWNGDGIPDLAVAAESGSVTVLLGSGAGRFLAASGSPVAVGAGPFWIVTSDWNRDGRPDVAVLNAAANTVSVLLGDGTGRFSAAPGSPVSAEATHALATGDFNGDGKPDLAAGSTILLGDGLGGFRTAGVLALPAGAGTEVFTATSGDFDGNNRADVALTYGPNCFVFLGSLATPAVNLHIPEVGVRAGEQITLVTDVAAAGIGFEQATGNVLLRDGSTVLATVTLSGGSATRRITATPAGVHNYSAEYAGDSRYAAATPATATLTVNGVGSIVAIAGTPQSASIQSPFAVRFRVRVRDLLNVPIANEPVTFTPPGAGASGNFIDTATVLTDANGLAEAPVFWANSTAGTYSVIASAGGRTAAFALTNTAGDAAAVTPVAGASQSARINTPFQTPLQVRVTDAGGNVVPGASVVFSAPWSGAGGIFRGNSTVLTNASGVAAAPAMAANGIAGTYSVYASTVVRDQVGDRVWRTATIPLTNTALPSGTLTQVANPIAGTALTPTSVCADDFNRDGRTDVAIVGSTPPRYQILIAGAGGTFSAAPPVSVGPAPVQILCRDMSRDGNPDLVILHAPGDISILRGNGTGGFTQIAGSPFSAGIPVSRGAILDVTADGILDIAVAGTSNEFQSLRILSADEQGRLVHADGDNWIASGPITDVVALPRPGAWPRLAVATNPLVRFFSNSESIGVTQGASVTLGATGAIRLAIAAGELGLAVGANGFTVLSAGQPAGSVLFPTPSTGVIANTDYLAAGLGDMLRVYSGPAQGALIADFPTMNTASDIAVGDFNGDGRSDVVTIGSASPYLSVLLGALAPTSTTLTTTAGPSSAPGSTISFSATVTAANAFALPSGVVDLVRESGTTSVQATPANPYSVTFQVTTPANTQNYVAEYRGDSRTAPSTSDRRTIGTPLVANPPALSFTLAAPSQPPPPQTISLGGAAAGGTFSAQVVEAAPWLSVSPVSGVLPGTITVVVQPVGIAAGEYSANISINTGSGVSYVPVRLRVTTPITVTPPSLSLTGVAGETTVPSQGLSVQSIAPAAFQVAVSGGSWLTTGTSSGVSPAVVPLSINASGLDTGTYNASLVVSSSFSTSGTQIVPVLLTVRGRLSSSPASLALGTGTAATQQIAISASGSVNAAATATSSGGWLRVNGGVTAQSAIARGQSWLISVGANAAALAPGTYSGTVSVSAPEAVEAVSVPVSLVIAPPVQISPATVSFSTVRLMPAPDPVVLNISSPGATSSFTVTTSGEDWLKVEPLSGRTPGTVTVSVDPSRLAVSSTAYTGTISVRTADSAPAQTIAVSLSVREPGRLTGLPEAINLESRAGAPSPVQTFRLTSSTEVPVPFTVDSSTANFLSVTPLSGVTPAVLTISADTQSIRPGTSLQGVVSVRTPAGTMAVPVAVRTPELPSAAVLEVRPGYLQVTTEEGREASGLVEVANTGGSAAVAKVTSDVAWLAGSPDTLAVGANSSARMLVRLNPAGLQPGLFTEMLQVSVTGTGQLLRLPVFLQVRPAAGPRVTMDLDFTALRFQVRNGEGLRSTQSVRVIAEGGAVQWRATVVDAANTPWLTVSPSNGSSTPVRTGRVTVGLNESFVRTRQRQDVYYGRIEITGTLASTGQPVANTPQFVAVQLEIQDPSTDPAPIPAPTGVTFEAAPGAADPATKKITVYTSSTTDRRLRVSAESYGGTAVSGQQSLNWLRASASSDMISTDKPNEVRVWVRPQGLAPGVYRGGVTLAIESELRVVNVTLVIARGTRPASARLQKTSPGAEDEPCTVTTLVPTFVSGVTGEYSAYASWGLPVEVRVMDNCNRPVPDPDVSESEPAVVKLDFDEVAITWNMIHRGDGLYTPDKQVNLRSKELAYLKATATRPDLESGTASYERESGRRQAESVAGVSPDTARVTGRVRPNPGPSIHKGGILSPFFRRSGAPFAPGSLIEIYGANLAAGSGSMRGVPPLPRDLNGTRVLVGGVAIPLLFVSQEQINAQLPTDLTPGVEYQIQVFVNEKFTSPERIYISGSVPGVAAHAAQTDEDDEPVIAQHADYAPVTPANPARPGEVIVLYLVGLGGTVPVVPAGVASPADPPARLESDLSVQLCGGKALTGCAAVDPGNIMFAGLAPGFAGLYQVNVRIPESVPPDARLVVVHKGAVSNVVSVPVANDNQR